MFSDTGWSYQTSSGIGLTVGELAEVTIQHARIYVNTPTGETRKIIAQGVGGGIGASIVPIGIAGSEASYRSVGSHIYSIYNEPITLADLSSFLLIYSGSGVVGDVGGTGGLVLFLHGTVGSLGFLAVPFFGTTIVVAKAVKAFCFMAGGQLASPNASIDGTAVLYNVASADIV